MSNPVSSWSSGYTADVEFFTFYGNYVFFANRGSGYVKRINLDGTNSINWVQVSNAICCTVYNNSLYVNDYNNGIIYSIVINPDGTAGAKTTFATVGNFCIGTVVANVSGIDYLFVTNNHGIVSKLSLTSDKSNDNLSWFNCGSDSYGMVVYNGFLYIANNGGSRIVQVNLSNPTIYNYTWAGSTQGVLYPVGLVLFNGYMYVSNNAGGQQYVNKISLTNRTTDYVSNFITGVSQPSGMAVDSNNYLYILSSSSGTIYKMNNSLLDNPKWSVSNGSFGSNFIVFYENYAYVSKESVMLQLNLNGTINNSNWATLSGIYPSFWIVNNGYLYVTYAGSSIITQILISNPPTIVQTWINLPYSNNTGITVNENILYVANYSQSIITRIPINPDNTAGTSSIMVSSGLNRPLGITYYGGYIYVANSVSNTISRILVSDPTQIVSNWANNVGLSYPSGLAVRNGYLYACSYGNSINIVKLSLTNTPTNSIWKTDANGLSYPSGLYLYGDYLYAIMGLPSSSAFISQFYLPEIGDNPYWSVSSNYNANVGYIAFYGNYIYYPDLFNNRIIRLNLNGTIDTLNWVSTNKPQAAIVYNGYLYVTDSYQTNVRKFLLSNPAISTTINIGVSSPQGLAQDNNYIYVASYTNGTITRISKSDDSFINNWVTGLNQPFGLCIDNGYLYVTNAGNNRISKILLSDPSIAIYNWASAISGNDLLNYPVGIVTNNGYLYVSSWLGNTISKISLSDPSNYVSNWKTSSDGLSRPGGLTFNETYIYTVISGISPQSIGRFYLEQPTPSPTPVILPPPCFKKDTKILTDKGYIPVQYLRKGDLVKTLRNEYKAIHMIGKKLLTHDALQERNKKQLFVYRRDQYPEILEDLVITGCHSILVDKFSSEQQREKTLKTNGDIYITDNKYRLPACVDEKAVIFEASGDYLIYHIALENEDYYMNYGIYANGLLVETCSKRYLKECSEMTLIGI